MGLKKSLLYSYQAATAVLSDGREFRCLINPDKNKPAYDNKEISIPFKDICLNGDRKGKTSQGEEEVGIKPGDVFIWKQTATHWLVYLRYLEEDAYFRAQIRRCDQSIQIDGQPYWVYIRGPVETSINWTQKAGIEWNSLNYSLVMYITADELTNDYFYRFKTIKVSNPYNNTEKTWQVVGVDPYYGDGIIQVFLDEYFENSIQDAVEIQNKQNADQNNPIDENTAHIEGPVSVSQYDKAYFTIVNASNGKWFLRRNEEEKDLNYSLDTLPLNISTKNTGIVTVIYRIQGQEDITLDVNIVAF